MARRGWLTACLWLVLFCTRGAEAQAPLALDALHEQLDLAGRVAMLRDEQGALMLHDVRKQYDAFRAHDGSPLSFGLDDAAIWLRFSAHNGRAQPVHWLLEVAEPTLERLELHVVHRDGTTEVHRTGTALPFASRSVRHANFVFELVSPPHDQAVYYVRARAQILRTPLRAWTPQAYADHHETDVFLRAMCLGAMLLVALYQLGLLTITRQVETAWYALVSLALLLVTMSINGQLAQLVLPNQPALVMRAPPFSIALAMITIAFFTYAATEQLKTHPELSNKLRNVGYATTGLVVLALFAPVRLALGVEFAILLLLCCAGPYLLYVVSGIGIPEMRRYTYGWYALILSIPLAILRYLGLGPDGPFGEWILTVGFVIYGVANSLALAAMASRLRNEIGAMNLKLVANVQELEQALTRAEEANDEARRATKAKDEFVATMSHELRTPLNAIINIPQGLIQEFVTLRSARCSECQASYLLDDDDVVQGETSCENCHQVGKLVEGTKVRFRGDDARCLRFLQKIERSGQHLLQMVNGVLDYSKMEAGRFELLLADVDLDALIREVGDQMVDLAQRKNIALELISSPANQGPIQGDVLRLKQVLINLIANAVKFSEAGSTVTMRWSTTSDGELVEVEDRGIGIAEADRERIFSSFEQVHKGDTRKYGGTGLGLSISRSLVRMHGGELTVRSELGKGSVFSVHLPRGPVVTSVAELPIAASREARL